MPKFSKKQPALIAIVCIAFLLIVAMVIYFLLTKPNTPPEPTASNTTNSTPTETPPLQPTEPEEAFTGETVTMADSFSIKVPNGWNASVSQDPSFLAIAFAGPNQLNSLVYNQDIRPNVNYNGITQWGGLTEHFFVISPTPAQTFNPSQHLEVSSEPFTFEDGFIGTKYFVVKHAEEAQKWGGLQKDTEWQGRTYIYEKDGKRIEAHIALYPSTALDLALYENVIKSIKP